jgi:acetyl/propionyl-CoA carboxylase alpha subunit
MSKSEIMQQSFTATNEKRVEHLAAEMEALRQAKLQSMEEFASMLEPLVQKLAVILDETRWFVTEIKSMSREQAEKFSLQINASAQDLRDATAEAQKTAESMRWEQAEEFNLQINASAQNLRDATAKAQKIAESMRWEQAEEFILQINASARDWKHATAEAQMTAESMRRAGAQMRWRHYGLTLTTGLLSATLVSTLWLWRAPPVIRNNLLDTKALARLLKPSIIATLRASRRN